MTLVSDADLPRLDYEHCNDPADVHRLIAQARAQAPIAIGPHGPELLSYDLVRAALRDNRFEVPRGMFLAAQGITSGPLWERANNSLLGLDGESHTRLRRLVAKAFAPRNAERLRDTCIAIVTELTDPHLAAGHCDVVADIAVQYPIPVICALLGAPRGDWPLFSRWADDIFKMFSWDLGEHAESVEAAWRQLDDYVDDMVARRSCTLTDDLLSDLIRAEVDGDRLNHAELQMLAGGVLLAGTDTTRNQLAAAVQVLCDYPDQWLLLAEKPDMAPLFVDELLRHTPIAMSTVRITRDDVDLGGLTIAAGTQVALNIAAANRDPQVYDDPERFDVNRVGPPAMMTFGGGLHYCLGVHLARVELTEALRVLTGKLHNPRCDGRPPWKPMTGITGPATLPVTFDAA
ncbi:cytochrome P450 [Mycobacterium sp. TNTM28]|uniref:Cytochrome P450 n=1 Tax=[Mycobacterium] fortunisiensis TaxID=2600579 RepID=A0ABS6KPI3_9MYCO|nr:cytochrome P450 [[Mycobacterium] fortunisiensis]MBU9765524.1 cytochrome P450 [[Mycobacterium] fortunisiensis]